MIGFRLNDGARSDQRHFSPQNVDYLGNFIQAPAAEKAPDRRHPWIVPALVHSPLQDDSLVDAMRTMGSHGTKLPDPKRHAKSTDALFGIKHGIGRRDKDRHGNEDARDEADREHQDSAYDIQAPLYVSILPGAERQIRGN